jgi:8-oxo-dGTP pyrophosphatase MutT (NUDIX family)
VKAAGILFVSMNGNALFLRRTATAPDCPACWDFPGGGQEGEETAEQTAIRETREEIGQVPDGVRILHTRTRSGSALQGVAGPGASPLGNPVDGGAPTAPSIVPAIPVDVDYTTFLQRCTNEFVPELNDEHDGYAWSPITAPPEPLHPGCRIALERLSMDELDVAYAIRDGRLTSPQRYENMTLWAIRITGTGASYRPKVNEFVFRDEDIHLTERMLARCNGLAVIFKHPAKALLNSEEFANRIVGTVFLPYVAGDEVWGIVKIYDDETNRLLDEENLSTSPGVNFKDFKVNRSLRMEDGSKVLIEGKPSLVDHVAICELGVWDKGGDPSGIRSESREDTAMADEAKKEEAKDDAAKKDAVAEQPKMDAKKDAAKDDAARKDADAGKSLDEKLSHVLDAVTGCMDAVKRVDARMDAMDEEKKKADAAKKDEFPDKEAEKTAADKAKKDAAEKEEEEKKKADAAKKDEEDKAKADAAGLGDRIAAVERAVKATDAKITPIPDDDHSRLADAWAIADDACRALGMNGPRAMPGETSAQFRRRVVKLLKPHSATWKDVDIGTAAYADEAMFAVVEKQVLTDAARAARDPANVAGDQLRMIERKADGHTIREFVGRPASWMNQFAGPVQLRGEGKFLTDNLGKN